MTTVAGVKFRNSGKVYYFSPGGIEDICIGTNVIVETAQGLEFASIALCTCEVDDSEVVLPLRKIVRIATEEDVAAQKENDNKKEDALKICQEKIDKHNLGMKLIDVDYTFDGSKVVFYFSADGRVDFRELVKDLAGVFKTRIELRQIGVRDEAKMIGGCGSCGKALCCASWMPDFHPVSIKMAKNQNLSLNPAKISGICGRLMCCLKYENDVYTELHKGMPKVGETVKTPDGIAKVIEIKLLVGQVRVRLYTDEEDENGDTKLSSDVYTYHKADIKRMHSKKKNSGSAEKTADLREDS